MRKMEIKSNEKKILYIGIPTLKQHFEVICILLNSKVVLIETIIFKLCTYVTISLRKEEIGFT